MDSKMFWAAYDKQTPEQKIASGKLYIRNASIFAMNNVHSAIERVELLEAVGKAFGDSTPVMETGVFNSSVADANTPKEVKLVRQLLALENNPELVAQYKSGDASARALVMHIAKQLGSELSPDALHQNILGHLASGQKGIDVLKTEGQDASVIEALEQSTPPLQAQDTLAQSQNKSSSEVQGKVDALRGDKAFQERYFSDNPQIRNAAIQEMNSAYEAGNAPAAAATE